MKQVYKTDVLFGREIAASTGPDLITLMNAAKIKKAICPNL